MERFRNVVDSTPVLVEPDVTCLVGKNESGKTALLQALRRVNPPQPEAFDAQQDYPRWRLVADRRASAIDDVAPIHATFRFDDTDRAAVEEVWGPASWTVTLSRSPVCTAAAGRPRSR